MMFGLGVGSNKRKDSKKEEKERDRLRQDAIAAAEKVLLSASGVPGTADALAYEPIQGLAAVASSDGKVKLLGRPGCEVTFYSAAKYPYATRQLQFLQNRGVLVRVSKGGFMECWSVASGGSGDGGVRPLGSVRVRGDKICCVADMARDPYVLLGCASGSLRIAMLVDAAGNPTTHPRQARGFAIAPYRVRTRELCGSGEVRQLAVQSFGPIHRALVLFTCGVVSVWDLRATELVTSIDPSSPEAPSTLATAGEATAVCWIGTERGDFASGHVDGSVLVWALQGLGPGEAAVAAVIRVVEGAAEPVRMLRCVFGEVDGLLVLGGQEVEQPEGLTWLALPPGPEEEIANEEVQEDESDEGTGEREGGEEQAEEDERRARRQRRRRAARKKRAEYEPVKLPWFGHLIGFCLVMDGGCTTGYEPPGGVLQLVEGGQLVLYNLKEGQPHHVGPFFQQRTTITVTEAPLIPVRRPAGCSPNAISLTALRKLAAGQSEDGEEAPEDPSTMAIFHSGVPPVPPADASWSLAYCTGYKDGGVCLWDLHGGTTRLLCSAPAGDALEEVRSGGSSAGSVTCLSLVWPTGLLLAGHHKGEVRMYQFSPTARTAECVTLESVNMPGTGRQLHQPSGLQLRLRVQVSSGEITSLAYCQAIRAVAAGDKAGGVALIDTAKPLVRWYAMPAQQAVLACALAPLPLPPARVRVPEVTGEEGAPAHAVVIADSEGRLAALDAARGCFIGRNGELSPKNHSYTLALELLDADFNPLWSQRQMGSGCDQAALAGGSGGPQHQSSGKSVGHSSAGRGAGSAGEERDESEDEDDPAAPSARGSGREGGTGRRGGSGRRPTRAAVSGRDSGSDSSGSLDGDLENMDVEALLAGAAGHVDGTPARQRHRKPKRGTSPGAPPPVLTSCPDPTAHYVLLVTDQYLRLYSTANVVAAERTTLAKRSPAAQQQLVYARPIQTAGGAPGIMALASAEHGLVVQIYSLPSLELVSESPLSASLSWYWDVPPGHERRLGRLAATSRLGHLLLLGLSNELLTLGLTAGLPAAAAPRQLFDLASATASLAAATKYVEEHDTSLGRLTRTTRAETPLAAGSEQAPEGSGLSEVIEGVDSPLVRTEGRRLEKPNVATAVAAPINAAEKAAGRMAGVANVTLSRVFNKVQQGLTRAVEETTKGVRQLATNMERGVATVGAALIDGSTGTVAGEPGQGPARGRAEGTKHSAEWYASLPDLGAVFSRTVPEEDSTVARLRRRQARREAAAAVEEDDDDDDDVSILSILDDDDDDDAADDHGSGRNPFADQSTSGSAAPRGSAAAGAQQQPAPRRPAAPLPGTRSAGGDEATLRQELFGGARHYTSAGGGALSAAARTATAGTYSSAGAGPSGQPRTRTAEEIKRAYGRAPADSNRSSAASGRANEVRAVMEQNRSKLEERGEKLRQLGDKAADLESSAAGFAAMARQLAEKERNKKWWQL